MDLGDGAIDAPASAHFAPMKDEFLSGRGEWRTLCVFSHFCIDRKYSSDGRMSSANFRENYWSLLKRGISRYKNGAAITAI